MVSIVRIAINNLAGVPSIVFGVFGLGFFVYLLGGSIDRAFFWSYEGPVFGQGGVLWASFTLALLTLPVVIVATEEALSAVPNSMREGSYACGASKWQTIRHIVLPRAMPGVFTGLILAVARGAGEVAPLMLVGVLEHAPELPIDGVFPYVHPDRPFMHLGFSIYHSAFKSQNSDAARPLVFTITLLLIVLIAVLNLIAIWMRSRFRRRFTPSAF
jgi:phosphate transport system permease protein